MRKSQNVRLLLEYDGSCFGGWQRVENGKKPSVQGTLEEVITESLSELSRKREAAVPDIQVIGSGRTDAGVHALGQVANVHLPLAIWRDRTPKEWRVDWNCLLPKGVRICLAEEVPQTFHSRYDAIGKTYCYIFDRRETPSAFAGRYAYWLGSGAERKNKGADRKDRGESGKGRKRRGKEERREREEKGKSIREWNQEAVKAASRLLIGEHDFSAFSSRMEPGRGRYGR